MFINFINYLELIKLKNTRRIINKINEQSPCGQALCSLISLIRPSRINKINEINEINEQRGWSQLINSLIHVSGSPAFSELMSRPLKCSLIPLVSLILLMRLSPETLELIELKNTRRIINKINEQTRSGECPCSLISLIIWN